MTSKTARGVKLLTILSCVVFLYILLGNSVIVIINVGMKIFQNTKIDINTKVHNTYNFKRARNSTKKLVLYWNRPSDWHHVFDKCEYNNCAFTDDRKDFYISDAVLFHAPVVNMELHQIPKKTPNQIWVYMSQEPPSEVYTSYKKWRNVFNWTWTNRRDSDIFDPYGEIHVRKRPDKLNYSEIFKNKTRTAFWYVSHCKTQSKREDYVKILQDFIDIDVYGKCADVYGKCEKVNGKCKTSTAHREERHKSVVGKVYKFYLAFENSLCKDYITEKVLHLIADPIIPIIRGEPDIEKFVPAHSYVATKHFKSAKHLGKYLQSLENNETEYISYFDWRKHYVSYQIATKGICTFCKLLTKADEHRKLYDNIDAFVNTPGNKPVCNENPKDIYG